MHKYQPRVHIIKKKDHTASLLNLKSEEFRTFIFPETVFTAVTAYQNQLVSALFTVHLLNKIRTQEVLSFSWGEQGSQYLNQFSLESAIEYQPGPLRVLSEPRSRLWRSHIAPSFLEPVYSWLGCSLPTLRPKPAPIWLLKFSSREITCFLFLFLIKPPKINNHTLIDCPIKYRRSIFLCAKLAHTF